MNEQETIYMMALTKIRNLGITGQHTLFDHVTSATTIMEQRHHIQDLVPQAPHRMADIMDSDEVDDAIRRAEEEYAYDEAHHIRRLCLHDEDYPSLLRDCPDAPLVLYYLGDANLHTPHIVSIVGTRQITPYGKDICRDFIATLHSRMPDTLIVSGLAYGVDIHAHRAALDCGAQTIGVLAHGLDTIYPALHRDTAARMTTQGGLLTEYMSWTRPDKGNFVRRNRIVAGMAQATIVIESGETGGSLITARLARNYGRNVCAFPGRATDPYSKGCNRLISLNEANAIASVDDFVRIMNWNPSSPTPNADTQMELFPILDPTEQILYDRLEANESLSVNLLTQSTGLSFAQVSATLYEMEEKGLVRMVGGSRFQLIRHL